MFLLIFVMFIIIKLTWNSMVVFTAISNILLQSDVYTDRYFLRVVRVG